MPDETAKLIRQLKTNKSPDIFGISTEHIKYSSDNIKIVITHLINKAIRTGELPDDYKLGSICPVQKKSNPPK